MLFCHSQEIFYVLKMKFEFKTEIPTEFRIYIYTNIPEDWFYLQNKFSYFLGLTDRGHFYVWKYNFLTAKKSVFNFGISLNAFFMFKATEQNHKAKFFMWNEWSVTDKKEGLALRNGNVQLLMEKTFITHSSQLLLSDLWLLTFEKDNWSFISLLL